jgi:hypothetical protein
MKSSMVYSRRGFVVRTISLIATTAAFTVFTPLVARSDASPSAADLEIATLGDWLRKAEPETASQLEAEARELSHLTATQSVDWSAARRALKQLTIHARVTAELGRADIVFVDGWLLARSEASAALLFSAARVQSKAGPAA